MCEVERKEIQSTRSDCIKGVEVIGRTIWGVGIDRGEAV